MAQRPLSPHLQVYRLPLTAVLSISHRFTGAILSVGLIYWVGLLFATAISADAFAAVHAPLATVPGRIALWLWLYSLGFHLCHGIRHLIWDTVTGLERETLLRHGIWELAASVVLVAVLFVLSKAIGSIR